MLALNCLMEVGSITVIHKPENNPLFLFFYLFVHYYFLNIASLLFNLPSYQPKEEGNDRRYFPHFSFCPSQ